MNRFKGMPSWAGARQKNVLSGVFRLPVSIQFTERHSLRCLGYRPGLTPDRGAFCRAFRGFPYPFSRQMSVLSGIPDTVLGVRPTEERSVWYFVVFGFHSVDRLVFSRVFRIPSWANARQKSIPSGVTRFSVFVQSTDERTLRCFGYPLDVRPTEERPVWYFVVSGIRSVDKSAFSRVSGIPSWAFARQRNVLSGVFRFSVIIQLTTRHPLGCFGYCPGHSPDRRAK